MFKNVLVGVDERDGGRDAIALGRKLLHTEGELTLAYIFWGDARISRAHSSDYDAVQYERAHELLEKAQHETHVQASLRWRGSPSVGRGLHDVAELIDADLLVVGSSRHSLLGRVMLGDDTRSALNGAPCAVAITPAGFARQPGLMREIGVGFDGSPESRHALQVARELAVEHGAKLAAFEAVSVPSYAFTGPVLDADWIESMVESARERVAALDGVEPHAVYGRPVEELALFSASVDLLIVGSRGYGPIGRLVHGSTSRQLGRAARCPLLVLPRAADTGDATGTLHDNRTPRWPDGSEADRVWGPTVKEQTVASRRSRPSRTSRACYGLLCVSGRRRAAGEVVRRIRFGSESRARLCLDDPKPAAADILEPALPHHVLEPRPFVDDVDTQP